MNTTGSIWQKWDLHVHTPASYHWDGQRFDGLGPQQKDALCKDVIDAMNATDVVAFCIMDYWTFDGYLILREYLSRNPAATTKRIFPGIEVRIVAPVNFKLNSHVLLSDEVLPEDLGHFISHLKLSAPGGKPPTRQNLIEAAKSYDQDKLKTHGCKPEDRGDDAKMLKLALETVLISRDSLREAMELVGLERCLLIQPYGTNDGMDKLDWKQHPYTDSELMKWADCFESRKQTEVDLFLNRKSSANESFIATFQENLGGYPKPVFSGSDAHNLQKYGVYPSNRATWLKAQPTFKGLKQVCHEPSLRCHIGERPDKLQHVESNPTKYIRSLSLKKIDGSSLTDEHWFHDKEVAMNPGLVAIIGNKGSGKSALADILALAGNSHCAELEFLNEERFRGGGNKAAHFEATLTWADGTSSPVNLNDDFDPNKPERVRYLPQHFIENLCNEIAQGNNTNFNKEIKKVIFNHVPEEDRLGLGSLDEVLDYLVQARKVAFAQEQQSLFALNEIILRNEQEMSAESIDAYEKALALKQLELDALENTPLVEVPPPPESPSDDATKKLIAQIEAKRLEHQQLLARINAAREERQLLVAEQATLKRLAGHLDNLDAYHRKFVAEHRGEFDAAGFEIDKIVTFAIDRAPIEGRVNEGSTRITELTVLLDGKPATETEPAVTGLDSLAADYVADIAKLQDGLNAPQKEYQAYLKLLAARTERRLAIVGASDKVDTIEYFKDRIKRAKDIIPGEVTRLRAERRAIIRKLHAELLAMRDDHVKLYAPVQRIASDAAKATHSIQLEFDASVVVQSFDSDFLNFIHRGRTGNFQGDDDSKAEVKELLKAHQFADTESVVDFTDAVLEKLTSIDRDGEKIPLSVASQLRDRTKVKQLYDFIFGLGYLDIRYNLRLGGKEISQLSPGEKGALLLVFYLLLDTEEIPIIIDQPEHNLDNESVVRLLVDCIRKARARRQVMIVTHNPNLAIYCDADQVVCCSIDKTDGHKIDYSTGAIEDYDINSFAVNVLEGTYAAFDNRRKKWHKPIAELCKPAAAVG